MVDDFGIKKDPSYAHEAGKPVVFIWGLSVPDRHFTPEVADAVVDFFKNDPVYGGNYVIGGIPGSWRKLDPAWQEHIRKYDGVLAWMSKGYAEDIADFHKRGLDYYPTRQSRLLLGKSQASPHGRLRGLHAAPGWPLL